MAELIPEQEEAKLKARWRSQRHIRAVLIVINLLLAGYILYFVGDVFVDYFAHKDDDIVAIAGLSRTRSKARYEELINGQSKTIGDYVVYGSYLHLSEGAFTPHNYTPLDKLWLKDASSGAEIALGAMGHMMNEGIDLASLRDGDYLLSQGEGSEKKVLKVVIGKDKIEDTIYTLPNSEGARRQIKLYAYPHNPAFVIKVSTVYKLPKDVFDLVIQGNGNARESVMSLFAKDGLYADWKVKELSDDSELSVPYSVKTTTALSLKAKTTENDLIINSAYVSSSYQKGTTVAGSGTTLDLYDRDAFIRELGGYAFKAGSRSVSSVAGFDDLSSSFAVASVLGIHDPGKMALVIEGSNETYSDLITDVLTFLTNED